MEFLLGIGSVFRGVGRLATTPSLWAYAIAPVVVAAVLLVGILAVYRSAAVEPVSEWARDSLGGGRWTEALATTLVWLLAAVAVFFVFSSIVRVVAAPFLSLLADRTVAGLSGRPTPVAPGGPLMRWIARPIFEALLVLGVRIAVTALALPLFLVPVVGGVLFSGVMMGLVGLDLLDIAQSARGVVLASRLQFVRRHLGACLGLGIGAGMLLLVPVVNVLLLPACVVAGVLLDSRIAPDFPKAVTA